MNNIVDDGRAVDRLIAEYRAAHTGTSYRDAYTALMREEETEEKQARKEFAKRVEAYKAEFSKSDADAARMVVAHDGAMTYAYGDGDSPALAARQGEIWREAKQRTNNGNMSMADAVLQILQSDREVSQKIAGDWLSNAAKDAVNNLNLGSSMAEAFPRAFAAVRRTYSEVDQQYQTGRVTELSMRTIFRQWFRD